MEPQTLHEYVPERPANDDPPFSAMDGEAGTQVQKALYLFAGVSRVGDVRHKVEAQGDYVVDNVDIGRGSEFNTARGNVFFNTY